MGDCCHAKCFSPDEISTGFSVRTQWQTGTGQVLNHSSFTHWMARLGLDTNFTNWIFLLLCTFRIRTRWRETSDERRRRTGGPCLPSPGGPGKPGKPRNPMSPCREKESWAIKTLLHGPALAPLKRGRLIQMASASALTAEKHIRFDLRFCVVTLKGSEKTSVTLRNSLMLNAVMQSELSLPLQSHSGGSCEMRWNGQLKKGEHGEKLSTTGTGWTACTAHLWTR